MSSRLISRFTATRLCSCAANRKRPVIRLLNWQTSAPDNLTITGATADEGKAVGEPTSWFTLDGITVTGRGVQVQGEVGGVTIRHSTLVPGWGLDCNCEPSRPSDPSLELDDAPTVFAPSTASSGPFRSTATTSVKIRA